MGRMQFGLWDTLFNLLILVFWFRIWNGADRAVVFNPYLAPWSRMAESSLGFLRPALVRISPGAIAALAVLILLVLRGLAVPRDSAWVLTLGFARQARYTPGASILFSVLSFAVFLFKLWGLTLIYDRYRTAPSEHTTGALHLLSRPFTQVKLEYRPLVLLGMGMLLAALIDRTGTFPRTPVPGALPVSLGWGTALLPIVGMQLAILAIAGWAQVLMILQQAMLLLIIVSWVSLFMSSHGLALICRDWMSLLLGPLRRYPIRLGPLDLSPIVFFIAVGMVQFLLLGILQACYRVLG